MSVRIATWGPVSVATTAWRFQSKLALTAICKLTFRLVPDGQAELLEPTAVRSKEEYEKGNPFNSVVGAVETAPMTPSVDVLLTGKAHAPNGTDRMTVRLAVQSATERVLDKSVLVLGDRSDPSAPPARFTSMPLTLAHAYGGIGFAGNPLGKGYGSAEAGAPNLVNPNAPASPAVFGPIPASFAARKKLLGATNAKNLRQPIVDLDSQFDWSYFQSAPLDQQLSHLQGNEWLFMEGVHPKHPQLRVQLPSMEGRAAFYNQESGEDVPMSLSMLHVDADLERLWLVWRGSLVIASEAQLANAIVVGRAAHPTEPHQWDNLQAIQHHLQWLESPAPAPLPTAIDAYATQELSPNLQGHGSNGPANELPFPKPETSPLANSPRTVASAHVDFGDDHPLDTGTIALTQDPPAAADAHPLEGTVALSQSTNKLASTVSTPFKVAEPNSQTSAQATIPGAPWAKSEADAIQPMPGTFDSTALPIDTSKLLAEAARAKAEAQEKAAVQQTEEAAAREEERLRALEEKRIQEEKRAQEEAERRRLEAAEKFKEEQEQARKRAQELAAEKVSKAKEAKAKMRTSIYGRFKRDK